MSTTSSFVINVRSLLPGPFYNCLVPVFTNSGSLQPRQVVYSSCSLFCGIQLLCGKYTEGFVVCQVFFSFGISSRPYTHAVKMASFKSVLLHTQKAYYFLSFQVILL